MFKCHSLGKEVACAIHVMLLVNMLASWTLIETMYILCLISFDSALCFGHVYV